MATTAPAAVRRDEQPATRFWRWPLLHAVAAYLVIRAIGVVSLAFAAHRSGLSMWHLLAGYDGVHYLAIAEHGYDHHYQQANGSPTPANEAFHPLFPALLATAFRLVPRSHLAIAIAVSWVCGIAAAAAVFRLGNRLRDVRTGVLLVGLWAALPHAIVGSMVYSENLFTALTATSLLLLLDRRHMAAAAACALAGLTRPTGLALAGVVLIAEFAALSRGRSARTRAGRGTLVAAAIVAPAGVLGYWAWVSLRTSRWDGYIWLQHYVWHSRFDGGADTARTMGRVMRTGQPFAYVVTTIVVLVSVAAAGFLVADRRVPWPVTGYAIALLGMALGAADYFHDKARLLLPAFPLLIPVAAWLARRPGRTQVIAVVLATVVSSWYGTYLLTVWRYSP